MNTIKSKHVLIPVKTEPVKKQLDMFDVAGHDLFKDLKPHIVKKFWEFHQRNPHIFELYKRFTNELVQRGRTRYGIATITERIRWHTATETDDPDFKISNNHGGCYARLLVLDNPSLKSFFQLRKTT